MSHTSTVNAPRPPHRSSRKRSYLPLQTAISLTAKLFNPNLKPHRPFRTPTNPSLRASQLPPPCAELDERPRRRVRRFMLWNDKVPPLRLIVLDPRKRGHLRRFNVFQIPSNPQPTRGIRTWYGDLKNLRPRPPHVAPGSFRKPKDSWGQPAATVGPPPALVSSRDGSVAGTHHPQPSAVALPSKPPRPTQSIAPAIRILASGTAAPSKTPSDQAPSRRFRVPTDKAAGRQMSSPTSGLARDVPVVTHPPTPPDLPRISTERPARQMSPTGPVPAQAGGVIAPVMNAPKVPSFNNRTASTVAPSRVALRTRSTPESRRAERAKLLQHHYVLEQQAERRWRMAMDLLVTKMLIFEAEHTLPSSTDEKPLWTDDVDIGTVMQWTAFMSEVRTRGNLWPHFELAQKDLPEWQKIRPVKGLTQARQRVKEANQKREETKRLKSAKIKAAREAKSKAAVEPESSVARGVGPTMNIPRKASPVLYIANPNSSHSPQLARSKSSHRTANRSSTGSSSSHHEHLVTPLTSTTSNSVAPDDKIRSTGLPSLGSNTEIPDEIAHHLADMLSRFQAIGLERAEKDRRSEIGLSQSSSTGSRRKGKGRKAAQSLEVSIVSDYTDSDASDALTIGDEKGSDQSWMTGDLNMDEDTQAVFSGAGTDAGSVS